MPETLQKGVALYDLSDRSQTQFLSLFTLGFRLAPGRLYLACTLKADTLADLEPILLSHIFSALGTNLCVSLQKLCFESELLGRFQDA